MVGTVEENKSGCVGLGFDLWRRSIVALGLDLKEKHDIRVIVVDLRFWVVGMVMSWLRCHHGKGGSLVLLLVALFLRSKTKPQTPCLSRCLFDLGIGFLLVVRI